MFFDYLIVAMAFILVKIYLLNPYYSFEMSELWLEALGSLKEGESIEGSFPCQLDYMKGYVVLTNQRMVFIQGGGGSIRYLRRT